MPDTFVSLGGLTFTSWGVPERINGGGRQALAVHQFIGGGRVIDAMGWVPDQIRFSGRLRGAGASSSVRLLETIARAGAAVVFSYWNNRYQVVVAKLAWRFERFYEITYDITLEVLTDLTQDSWQTGSSSVDSLVNADLTFVQSAAAPLPQLTDGIAAIGSSLVSAGPLQTATAADIASVSAAVASAAGTASSIQATLDASLPGGPAGQVIVGGNPVLMAASLSNQATSVWQLAAAVESRAILQRMAFNLTTVV